MAARVERQELVVGVDEGPNGALLVEGGVVGVAGVGELGWERIWAPLLDGGFVEGGGFDGVAEGVEVDVGEEDGGDGGGGGGSAAMTAMGVGVKRCGQGDEAGGRCEGLEEE